MVTWHRVQAKLTDKEWQHVTRFMKKHKILNTNQLVRYAFEEIIGLAVADSKRKGNLSLPSEYLTTYYFYKYCKKEFKSHPEISTKFLDEIFAKWRSGFFTISSKKQNESLWKANKMWNDFREHAKVGRSKNTKKSRGKPKNSDKPYDGKRF